MRACTSAYAFFVESVRYISTGVVEHHACAGVYVKQVSWTSAYTFADTLQDVHACSCTCSLVVWRWGNKDGGVPLVYERTCCLAWVVILTEGKIGVLSVSLFIARLGVCVGVCVCIRTHIHTHCTDGVLACEPMSRGWDTWRARRIQMD